MDHATKYITDHVPCKFARCRQAGCRVVALSGKWAILLSVVVNANSVTFGSRLVVFGSK